MADADALASFEAQKTQFATGLHALAEHLRACASQAEGFAQFLNASSLPNGQFAVDPNFIANAQTAVNGVAAALVPGKPGRKRKNAAVAADGTIEATPGKRRRALKERDPDMPKRPASSYILFQNDVRAQLKQKHPEMTHHEIMTRVSQLWASLPPEEKEVYEKKHAGMKVDYETRKAAYEHTKNGTTPVEVAPAATPVTAATPATAVATESDAESDETPSSPPPKKSVPAESDSEEEDEAVDADDDEDDSEEEEPPKKKSKSAPAPAPVAAPVHKKRKNKD